MALVRSFAVTATGAVGPSNPNGSVRLLGFQLTETAGVTNLTVTITDGGSAGGKVIVESVVTKGQSQPTAWFGPEGITVDKQVFVTVSGGTSASNVFIR